MSTLRRRLISLPLFFFAWCLALSTLPVWLPIALVVDVGGRGRLSVSRALLYLTWFLSCEVGGVLISGALWTFSPRWLVGERRWFAVHYALQLRWARALWVAAKRLFSLDVHVSGDEHAAPGPVVLLVRHVSVGDTLLPSVFVQSRGVRLRFVLKRELLWDPCLDIVGNRLPNVFIDRGSGDSDREREKVRVLAADLDERQGLLIFPEGTRFSDGKRARLIARAAEKNDDVLRERAESLTRVLPPRLGGVHAALGGCPEADVVICAHTGFEGISSLGDIFGGVLVRRRISIRFWRVKRTEIDADDEDWLMEQWREVDAWIGQTATA